MSIWPPQASLPTKWTLSHLPAQTAEKPIGSLSGPIHGSSFISVYEILYVSANVLSNKHENRLDRNHLIVLCTLYDHNIKIDTHTLVDYGCTVFSFMNDKLAG
jgi:hypothetical protein